MLPPPWGSAQHTSAAMHSLQRCTHRLRQAAEAQGRVASELVKLLAHKLGVALQRVHQLHAPRLELLRRLPRPQHHAEGVGGCAAEALRVLQGSSRRGSRRRMGTRQRGRLRAKHVEGLVRGRGGRRAATARLLLLLAGSWDASTPS